MPAAAQSRPLFPLDHFWSLPIDAPFAAPAAAGPRLVYVPLQTGQFSAFEPGRPEPVWSVELAVDGAPAVSATHVYASAAGAIHALDAATGALAWRVPAGPLAAPLFHHTGWLIVALADGGLQAVRAADGAVLWARSMGAALAAPPSIEGELLALALADGRVALLDLPTGAPRWQRKLAAPASGLTLSGDRIFAGTDDGFFWSLRTRDGDPDWRWRIGSKLIGAPAADTERIYAVAFDNVVRAFRRSNGNMRWSYPLTTRPIAGPMLVEGLVVITTGDVGAPGLRYLNSVTGAAAGLTPALPRTDATARTQFPIAFSLVPPAPYAAPSTAPFGVIVTATASGDWQLHAYRQTFLTAIAGHVIWGPRYEVRQRLDIWTGPMLWGQRVNLFGTAATAGSEAGTDREAAERAAETAR